MIKYLHKINLRQKGLFWLTAPEGYSSSGRENMNAWYQVRSMTGHIALTVWKQRVNIKWNQVIQPEDPPPVRHILHQG